jgi:hypothetical protein
MEDNDSQRERKVKGNKRTDTHTHTHSVDSPVDGREIVFLEIRIGLGEVATAKEAVGSGERAGVCRRQHEMCLLVDHLGFGLGVASPQQKHNAFPLRTDHLDDFVSQRLPAFPCMRLGLPSLHLHARTQIRHTILFKERSPQLFVARSFSLLLFSALSLSLSLSLPLIVR